jgi:tetratricopeptide (TPR) repeat protein/DNA-binding MarR family transcriptional regulator
MMHIRRPLALTVSKRILLHLKSFCKYKSEFEVPTYITQAGIGEIIGIRQHHVSRAITKLINDGLVYKRSAHVKGIERRRSAYFLTDKGLQFTSQLESKLLSQKVTVRDADGTLKEMRLSEVNPTFGTTFPVIDLKDLVSKFGIIEYKKLMEYRDRKLKPGAMFSDNVPPELSRFYGRERELSALRNALASETIRAIIVHGIPGIGKTTLVSKLAHEYKGKRPVNWYNFEPWSDLRHVIIALAESLAEMRRRELAYYMRIHGKGGRELDLSRILQLLESDLRELNAIFVFDNFHKVASIDKNVLIFFQALLRVMEKLATNDIIICSRWLPQFYDRVDVKVRNLIYELRLDGLDKASTKSILKLRGIGERDADVIYGITGGHPLAIEFIEPHTVQSFGALKKDLHTFFDEELFSELSVDEKTLLRFAAVFIQPVSLDAYLKVDGVSYETLQNAIKKSLIRVTPDAKYYVHDFIRDYFYAQLTSRQRIDYHKLAATHYRDTIEPLERIEMLYHLIAAEDYESAVKVAIAHKDEFISQSSVEFIKLIDEIPETKISPELLAELLSLKAEASFIVGDLDTALKIYEAKISRIVKDDKSKDAVAETFTRMGGIYGYMGEWNKTIQLQKESLQIFRKLGDKRGMIKAYNNLGVAYSNMHRFDLALKYYNLGLELLDGMAGEHKALAISHLNIGRVYDAKGDTKQALRYYKRCLYISKRAGNPTGEECAQANFLLGDVYKAEGKLALALRHYQQASDLFRNLGATRSIVEVVRNIGDIYDKLGDNLNSRNAYETAAQYLNEHIATRQKPKAYINPILRIFRSRIATQELSGAGAISFRKPNGRVTRTAQLVLDIDYNELAVLYTLIAEKYLVDDDALTAINYFHKAYELYQKLDNKLRMAQVALTLGKTYHTRAELTDAHKYYTDAIDCLRAVEDYKGLAVAHYNLGKVCEDLSIPDEALANYQQSLKYATKSCYDAGRIRAQTAINALKPALRSRSS